MLFNKHTDIVPKDAIYIGRGSKWGNPFIIGVHGDRDEVCDAYEDYAEEKFTSNDYNELIGKDLVCYCKPKRCHGEFLMRKAIECSE